MKKKPEPLSGGYQLAILLSVPAGFLLALKLHARLDSVPAMIAIAITPALIIGLIAWNAARSRAAG